MMVYLSLGVRNILIYLFSYRLTGRKDSGVLFYYMVWTLAAIYF